MCKKCLYNAIFSGFMCCSKLQRYRTFNQGVRSSNLRRVTMKKPHENAVFSCYKTG